MSLLIGAPVVPEGTQCLLWGHSPSVKTLGYFRKTPEQSTKVKKQLSAKSSKLSHYPLLRTLNGRTAFTSPAVSAFHVSALPKSYFDSHLVDGKELNLRDELAVLKIQGGEPKLDALFRADGRDCFFGPQDALPPVSITLQDGRDKLSFRRFRRSLFCRHVCAGCWSNRYRVEPIVKYKCVPSNSNAPDSGVAFRGPLCNFNGAVPAPAAPARKSSKPERIA